MAEFFDMGGYAMYVWPSFGMTAVLMVGLLIMSINSLRANQRAFDRLRADLAERNGSDDDEA